MDWNNVEEVEISVGTTFLGIVAWLKMRVLLPQDERTRILEKNQLDMNTINLHEMTVSMAKG